MLIQLTVNNLKIQGEKEYMFEAKVQRKLIWQQVLEHLRKQIVLGEIQKDEHLKEAELSEQLGVSRGPIREAIVQLEKEGLVHTLKNGRTKVVGFSIKDVEDLYYARMTIEKAAVDQIAFPLDSESLMTMSQLMEMMIENDFSTDQLNQLDLKFHYMLMELSNNKTLIQMWRSISGLIQTLMEIRNERVHTKRERILHHHQEILHALQFKDKEKIKSALEQHLTLAKDVFKTSLQTVQKRRK